MTTDRELLEAAARAARIEYDAEASKPHPKSGAFWGLWLVFHQEPSEHDRRYWNPLTDDGDALRLAAKLSMAISIHEGHCTACAQLGVMVTEKGGDTGNVIRRAIVRAAASPMPDETGKD